MTGLKTSNETSRNKLKLEIEPTFLTGPVKYKINVGQNFVSSGRNQIEIEELYI